MSNTMRKASNKVINVAANAKINLTLDVLSKRTDGYHNIETVMQSVSLCDHISIKKTVESDIQIQSESNAIPLGSDNIAYQAAKCFFEAANINHSGIVVLIEKHIPVAAGLAGGSADAAGVLTGLNELFETEFSLDELCKIGCSVGADIPFCIVGGTRLAQGIGEKLTSLPALPECAIVIAKSGRKESTAAAYKMLDSCDNSERFQTDLMIGALKKEQLKEIAAHLGNMFELVSLTPEINDIKLKMMAFGAIGAVMSGSGPSVFGLFREYNKAEKCVYMLKKSCREVFLCTPSDSGCIIL